MALARVLGIAGKMVRADAELVREATGYSIGGVAPLGHPQPLPLVIDASLLRFETVYAAAGHPHCVFATSAGELAQLTGGALVEDVGVAGNTNGVNYRPVCAQSLIPMDMIVSGWSISLFQAWQPASMMAS